ncbi:MAG: O-antigen ligase family protein [Thermoanaerobaculia bacterium]|nr:O-antigen ligase family protein [Thermoanaerobaculia bacterium]
MKSSPPFILENFGIERSKPLESAAFFLLLVFLVTAPFQWGAVLPGGKLTIELFAFAIASMILVSRAPLRALRAVAVPLAALALLALLGAAQLLPLGAAAIDAVAPFSGDVYDETNAVLAAWGRAPVVARISIAPYETKSAALLVASYAALLASSVVLLQSRRRRRVFVGVVMLNAIAHSMWATASFGPRESGRISGPFVNPNHFAGWLEIALGLGFALLWREVLHNRERGRGAKDRAEKIERRMMPVSAAILAWGVVAIGIGLTKSRGGIAAAVAATFLVALIALMHQNLQRRARLAVAIGAGLLAAVALTALVARDEPVIRFLESDPREIGADTRVTLWRTSLDAWRLSPHTGTGLGTFREAYRHVQPRELKALVEQAHSDPLQLLVTAGWIGFALGAIAAISTLVILVRRWKSQPHREEGAFALGGLCAIACLLLHGLVEFNFSIPAIPATLACVTGMAIAAAMYGAEAEGERREAIGRQE